MSITDGEKRLETLSNRFDRTCEDFHSIVDSDSTPTIQGRIDSCIKTLEELTETISALDMFSVNESYEEVNPEELKFLLLPYMLGTLWLLKITEDRRQVCQVAQTYFQDYIQRLADYGIISASPKIIHEDAIPRTPQENRAYKIAKLKENKLLEAQIKRCQEIQGAGHVMDPEIIQELYLTTLRRACNGAEADLEGVFRELEMVDFGERNRGAGDAKPSARKPIQTFIITRNATQKKIFGAGYPSLPIYTVEEMRKQREESGEWPTSKTPSAPPPPAEDKDLLEETDDPEYLSRQRAKDDYKDTHRAGWGNRANRS